MGANAGDLRFVKGFRLNIKTIEKPGVTMTPSPLGEDHQPYSYKFVRPNSGPASAWRVHPAGRRASRFHDRRRHLISDHR